VSLAILVSCGSRSEVPGVRIAATDAGLEASPKVAPPLPESCNSDTDCASDAYCLVGSCDGGCVAVPRNCDDGVSCTRDTCSESTRSCVHSPDDSLCPDTQLCSPRRDCDAFIYGVGIDNHLYEMRVPSAQVFDVGVPAAPITDVALTGSVLYATDSYILYRLDRATAADTVVASILPLHQYNGLGAAADGSLLATADAPSLFRIDPVTGASTAIAPIPALYRASGDVTTWTTRVLVPVNSLVTFAPASLASFDAITFAATVIGRWGDSCVYGIATLGGVVYGLDCVGGIFTVDPQTGTTAMVGMSSTKIIGAAGR
jgi:hypothetical protein